MKKFLLLSSLIFLFSISKAQLPVAAFQADDSTTCAGSCINFTNFSTNATSYQWIFQGANPSSSTAANPQNICFNNQGNFSVTLIASNSNGSDTLVKSNYITVVYPQNLNISTSGDTIFASQGFYHYQWYLDATLLPGDTLYYHVALQDGTHYLVCIDTNGCENGLATFGPLFIPGFFPSDTEFCAGSCIGFTNTTQWLSGDSAFATHQWYFNGATPALSQNYSPQNICYNNPGSYLVKYIVLVGITCSSDSFLVNVQSCTGIEEESYSSNLFSVSMDPVNEGLMLHFIEQKKSEGQFIIFNSVGKSVLKKEVRLENQLIDVHGLNHGIYLIYIKHDNEIFSCKFIR